MSSSGNGCGVSRYETWRALPVLAQHGHMLVRDYARSMALGTIAKLGHYPISMGVMEGLNAWF